MTVEGSKAYAWAKDYIDRHGLGHDVLNVVMTALEIQASESEILVKEKDQENRQLADTLRQKEHLLQQSRFDCDLSYSRFAILRANTVLEGDEMLFFTISVWKATQKLAGFIRRAFAEGSNTSKFLMNMSGWIAYLAEAAYETHKNRLKTFQLYYELDGVRWIEPDHVSKAYEQTDIWNIPSPITTLWRSTLAHSSQDHYRTPMILDLPNSLPEMNLLRETTEEQHRRLKGMGYPEDLRYSTVDALHTQAGTLIIKDSRKRFLDISEGVIDEKLRDIQIRGIRIFDNRRIEILTQFLPAAVLIRRFKALREGTIFYPNSSKLSDLDWKLAVNFYRGYNSLFTLFPSPTSDCPWVLLIDASRVFIEDEGQDYLSNSTFHDLQKMDLDVVKRINIKLFSARPLQV